MAVAGAGAALQSVIERFGGRVIERESRPLVGTTATAIVSNNPDRLALIVINESANDFAFGLTPQVTATTGIRLGANGGMVSMDVIEDLTLPAREWYGVASAAGSQIYVLEVIRDVLSG